MSTLPISNIPKIHNSNCDITYTLLSHNIKGLQVRARANQIELNEKSTQFVYKLETIQNDKNKIERLNINYTIIEDANKISSELHNYFKDILSTKITNIDYEAILEFVSNNENITILSNLDSINLDSDLSDEEFEKSIKDMIII